MLLVLSASILSNANASTSAKQFAATSPPFADGRPEGGSIAGASCDNPVDWTQAGQHAGKTVAVRGPVVRVTQRADIRGGPTWIDVGEAFPTPNRLTLLIWNDQRPAFEQLLSSDLRDRGVCAIGQIRMYEGRPTLTLKSPAQLTAYAAAASANRRAGSPEGSSCSNPIWWSEAGHHAGRRVSFRGPITRVTHRSDINGTPTWVEMGEPFPSPNRVSLVIWGERRHVFGSLLSRDLRGREVCVTGSVKLRDGIANVELRSPEQLLFE